MFYYDMTTGKVFNVLTVIFLIIGLIVGTGIGSQIFPKTFTETLTKTTSFTKIIYAFPKEITTVRQTSTVLTTLVTSSSIVMEDEKIGKVEGGGIIAWGWGLGRLEEGDIVRVEFSSVHKVLVCLDQRPKEEIGWRPFTGYYECAKFSIDDAGSYEWIIERPGYYALIIGKQAGYLSSSFRASITVVRTTTITTVYTSKINMTQVLTTTSFSTAS